MKKEIVGIKMIKEIGGEYWLDNNIVTNNKIDIPSWIGRFGNISLTSSGRSAISLLLQQVKPKNKSVLLPTYICESVIKPFIEQNYKCYFYDINSDLTPNISHIITFKDIGIFLHLGYFGFFTNQNLKKIIAMLKEKGTLIVEDVTHTLFSNQYFLEENDYSIASIRKWLGIPSGGFLASIKNLCENTTYSHEKFVKLRTEALLLKGMYIKNNSLNSNYLMDNDGFYSKIRLEMLKKIEHQIIENDENLKMEYLELFSNGEKALDNDPSPYSIDQLSRQIIYNINEKDLIKARRQNYMELNSYFKSSNYFKSVLNKKLVDECPIFFPIYIEEKRDEIRKMLINDKIYCPIHWPIPNSICSKKDKTYYIYDKILSIPCDQRYTIDDMKRIISFFKNYED